MGMLQTGCFLPAPALAEDQAGREPTPYALMHARTSASGQGTYTRGLLAPCDPSKPLLRLIFL